MGELAHCYFKGLFAVSSITVVLSCGKEVFIRANYYHIHHHHDHHKHYSAGEVCVADQLRRLCGLGGVVGAAA